MNPDRQGSRFFYPKKIFLKTINPKKNLPDALRQFSLV
jgi:hypothetical protein